MKKVQMKTQVLVFIGLICSAMLLSAVPAFAEVASDSLPWEKPLEKIVKSLTGYWAYAVVLIAFVASAATMFFGQAEMQGWVRNLIFLIMVASFLVGGGMFAQNILGINGMLIP